MSEQPMTREEWEAQGKSWGVGSAHSKDGYRVTFRKAEDIELVAAALRLMIEAAGQTSERGRRAALLERYISKLPDMQRAFYPETEGES